MISKLFKQPVKKCGDKWHRKDLFDREEKHLTEDLGTGGVIMWSKAASQHSKNTENVLCHLVQSTQKCLNESEEKLEQKQNTGLLWKRCCSTKTLSNSDRPGGCWSRTAGCLSAGKTAWKDSGSHSKWEWQNMSWIKFSGLKLLGLPAVHLMTLIMWWSWIGETLFQMEDLHQQDRHWHML